MNTGLDSVPCSGPHRLQLTLDKAIVASCSCHAVLSLEASSGFLAASNRLLRSQIGCMEDGSMTGKVRDWFKDIPSSQPPTLPCQKHCHFPPPLERFRTCPRRRPLHPKEPCKFHTVSSPIKTKSPSPSSSSMQTPRPFYPSPSFPSLSSHPM